MDSQIHHGKRQRAQSGVSLIEVLVVLVILVVGILTIIRLFPSGFFSIQSTGNAALANSLGSAAIDLGAQNAENLPDAILPDDLAMDNLTAAMTNAAAYSNYDPDDPNNLENARVVSNETITVPTVSNNQSVYVVKYGPVSMPADPTSTVAQFPLYFTVNSPYWTAQTGNSAPVGNTMIPTDTPQDTLVPGHEQFLVDLANQRIAVPYASYTLNNAGTSPTYVSYDQKMVVVINYYDSSNSAYGTATQYLDIPPGTTQDSTNPYAPRDSTKIGYLSDTATNYQGGWFDPTKAVPATNPPTYPPTFDYADPSVATPHQTLPPGATWVSVALYRPYAGVLTPNSSAAPAFSNDPYQFALLSPNIVTTAAAGTSPAAGANPGVVSFNPKAATGSGAQARKAQISYIVYSWGILREDHDIPALTGGSTFTVRTAVPNLLLAGSANPDNSINTGIAGSNDSMVIIDLDTGGILAPLPPTSAQYDPTNTDKPINNEDLNGTSTDPAAINVSYSLGRLTFGSQVFPNGRAHRIRIFYTADLNWAVAVQKTPAYFTQAATSPAGTATGTTPLGAGQFAYDSADGFVYFARCNAGKTVEVDGTYTTSGAGGTTQGFSDTVSIDPTLYSLGDSAVRVDLTDGTKFEHPVPKNAAVTFSAVRGLSARSVVAWKERNVYKVHSVDAVLNRTP